MQLQISAWYRAGTNPEHEHVMAANLGKNLRAQDVFAALVAGEVNPAERGAAGSV
jgi:hypothetical protein